VTAANHHSVNIEGFALFFTYIILRAEMNKKELSPAQSEELFWILKVRFDKNTGRHSGMDWDKIKSKLEAGKEKCWSLSEMERTGGEPDVVGYDIQTGEYIFFDCSPESPGGRRSLCYDEEARMSRKSAPPENSATGMASAMGIGLLTEEQYAQLQELGELRRFRTERQICR